MDINSTMIKGVEYDKANKSFKVQFHSGKTYEYKDVSPAKFNKFMAAESKGKFLNTKIKPKHEFSQMEKEAFWSSFLKEAEEKNYILHGAAAGAVVAGLPVVAIARSLAKQYGPSAGFQALAIGVPAAAAIGGTVGSRIGARFKKEAMWDAFFDEIKNAGYAMPEVTKRKAVHVALGKLFGFDEPTEKEARLMIHGLSHMLAMHPRSSSKTAESSEKIAMIVEEEGDFVLYTKDGSKILGRHPTMEKALAQERAIEISKAK